MPRVPTLKPKESQTVCDSCIANCLRNNIITLIPDLVMPESPMRSQTRRSRLKLLYLYVLLATIRSALAGENEKWRENRKLFALYRRQVFIQFNELDIYADIKGTRKSVHINTPL